MSGSRSSRCHLSLPFLLMCLLGAAGCAASNESLSAGSQPERLLSEGRVDPLGIGLRAPRLGWWSAQEQAQSGWQVVASTTKDGLENGEWLWDSGKVSGVSSEVVYGGPALLPQQAYYWKVRTWDAEGKPSAWSMPARWETGLGDGQWQASWIATAERDTQQSVPAVYFRKTFTVPDAAFANSGAIVSARLYVTARGVFEGELNAERIGEDYLVPGWTDFNRRNQYLTYDVTDSLTQGENVLGFILADGWHNGYLKWDGKKNWYGKDTSLLAQLVIRYADGSTQTVVTDASWLNRTGPILVSDLYDGETYDARLELGGWSRADYEPDAQWQQSRVLDLPEVALDAKIVEPVRVQETILPVAVARTAEGEWIYDFGQNVVGWVKLRMKGKEGETVRLRFAEMLNQDGTLYLENLRGAKATDTYIFGETGTVEWEPRFTFHGFRYAGIVADAEPEFVEAVVLHNDMAQTGWFETSNPLVNRLQENIAWGLRGNFLEVPTDCPQRDERLGWTGDAQIFVRTAIFNRDVKPFFEKWLADVRDAQGKDGQVPFYAPNLDERNSCSGWGDAMVICPWALYEYYGDPRVLEDNYAAMKAWVDYQVRASRNLIRPPHGFGDWLALDKENPTGAGDTNTPKSLVGTAYFAHTADLLSQAAAVLGKDEDARHYAELRERVRTAFQKEFVSADGRVSGNTQTAYLLALGFDLVPENLREAAAGYLVDDIRERGWHLTTGFLGTGLLMPVLDQLGRNDVAYRLLLQEGYPGWLYSIRQGATTTWERWNSYTHENGFGNPGMNSFNHYAYGAVGEWMYGVIGGIVPLEPGFAKVRIRPVPGGDLTWAKTRYEGPRGPIVTDWALAEDGTFTLALSVPANTLAVVELPDGRSEEVGPGSYRYTAQMPVVVE